jgi:ubiquinone/menaquinone biosynthesis C-methylase UbiE
MRMGSTYQVLVAVSLVTGVVLVFLGWRWASRNWSLPCPALFAWALESSLYGRLTGTDLTIERIGLGPGQRVLEIGPGPGRLLIPAAKRVLPEGEVVGVDIQPGMIKRLKQRAKGAGVANLTAVLGDATTAVVPEASFDVVFLATTLGEIPDRPAVLRQCFRALRPGGVLSITEMLPDPHYQSQRTVRKLAEQAGFVLTSIHGGRWLFTANFVKPAATDYRRLRS